MLAKTETVALIGTEAHLVQVEVDVGAGVPRFSIVGLPTTTVREAEQRTRSALESSGLRWPRQRMVANLAPGGLRKDGTHFDVPLALGIAAADKRISQEPLEGWIAIGELALDGSVRPVRGSARCSTRLSFDGAQGADLSGGERGRGGPGRRHRGGRSDEPASVHRFLQRQVVTSTRRANEGGCPVARRRRCTCARSGNSQASARDRGGRGSQPLDAGPSRVGQDHAGAHSAGDPASDDAGRVVGGDSDLFGRGHAWSELRCHHATSLPDATPPHLDGGHHRWGFGPRPSRRG